MIDEKLIADLKAKHKRLVAVESPRCTLVFKSPSRAEFDRWTDSPKDERARSARELAQACLVHPSYDEFIAALDDEPGLLLSNNGVLDAITTIAGFGGENLQLKIL